MHENSFLIILTIFAYVWNANEQFCWSKATDTKEVSDSKSSEKNGLFKMLTINYKNLLDNVMKSEDLNLSRKKVTQIPKPLGPDAEPQSADENVLEPDDIPNEAGNNTMDDGCSEETFDSYGNHGGCNFHGGFGCCTHPFSGMGYPWHFPFFGWDFIPIFHGGYPFGPGISPFCHCPFCGGCQGCKCPRCGCPLHGSGKNDGSSAGNFPYSGSGCPLCKKFNQTANNFEEPHSHPHNFFCPFNFGCPYGYSPYPACMHNAFHCFDFDDNHMYNQTCTHVDEDCDTEQNPTETTTADD